MQNKQNRKIQLIHWLQGHFSVPSIELHAIQNDASFRQYYRCTINGSSYVVMDAPPDKENIVPFIKMTQIFSRSNVFVPEIIACNQSQGWMLLSDFGSTWLLSQLKESTSLEVAAWYQKAIDQLIGIQCTATQAQDEIPIFNAAHIMLELSYFSQWFINTLLKYNLSPIQDYIIQNTYAFLTESALNQPQVLIHRDYHSRNLMVLPDAQLGVIDYQDAMQGPISYDLASLLKDCYINWSGAQIESALQYYYEKADKLGLLNNFSFAQLKKSFTLIGLQRHLKVLGIFSRLKIRDHKAQYINDMPRIVDYVRSASAEYSELSEFHKLFTQDIIPVFTEIYARQESVCVQ